MYGLLIQVIVKKYVLNLDEIPLWLTCNIGLQ